MRRDTKELIYFAIAFGIFLLGACSSMLLDRSEERTADAVRVDFIGNCYWLVDDDGPIAVSMNSQGRANCKSDWQIAASGVRYRRVP